MAREGDKLATILPIANMRLWDEWVLSDEYLNFELYRVKRSKYTTTMSDMPITQFSFISLFDNYNNKMNEYWVMGILTLVIKYVLKICEKWYMVVKNQNASR